MNISIPACLISSVTLAFASPAAAQMVPHHIQAAIESDLRSDDNVARDDHRRPGEVLTYFGVEPGMNVLDLYAYGGYFTELLAVSVGDDGHVYALQRPGDRTEGLRAEYEAQYARLGNVSLLVADAQEIPLEDNSVDLVFLTLLIHHMHFDEATPGRRPDSSGEIYEEIRRVLRPGGIFAVIEHEAIAGVSREQSASWHRIDQATAVADVTASGFEFAGDANHIHRYPTDDNANFWRETLPRGTTNRLVLTFRNPE